MKNTAKASRKGVIEKRKAIAALIAKIKKHPTIMVVCFLGLVVGSIASFTESISKLTDAFDKYSRGFYKNEPLVFIIDSTGSLSLNFTLVNTAEDRTLKITEISATQLVGIDLCSYCETNKRVPLLLSVRRGQEADLLAGRFRDYSTKLFGRLETSELAPLKSESFSLQVEAPLNEGTVFYISVRRIDQKDGESTMITVPYLFYVIGPHDYEHPALGAVTFAGWPEHTDARLRSLFANALGRLRDSRSFESLVRVAKLDPDFDTRAAAIEALASFPNDNVPSLLLSFLGNTSHSYLPQRSDPRVAAAHSLGKLRTRKAIPSLLKIWRESEDSSLTSASINALGQIGGTEVTALLMNILKEFNSGQHRKAQERSFVISALAKTKTDVALQIIIEELRTPDAYARWGIVDEIGEFHSALALSTLTHLIDSDKDDRVIHEAINTLGRIGGDTAALLLIKYIETHDSKLSSYKRSEAVYALAQSQSQLATQTLLTELLNVKLDDAESRRAAAMGLENYTSTAVISALRTAALKDPYDRVRYMAMRTLARFPSEENRLLFLKVAAEDTEEWLKKAAIAFSRGEF